MAEQEFTSKFSGQMGERHVAAKKWLARAWTEPALCPLCNSNEWAVGFVVELRSFAQGRLAQMSPTIPVFPVSCNVCGYTFTVNALVAGVVKEEDARTPHPTEPLAANAPLRTEPRSARDILESEPLRTDES